MTAKELATEIFDLTEELRLAAPMIRWDKKEDAITYWEDKILKVAETLNKPVVIKTTCPRCKYKHSQTKFGKYCSEYCKITKD